MSKAFAFYFPQYCAEPLNDEAWYPGFTDWDLIKNILVRNTKDHKTFLPKVGFYSQETKEVVTNQIMDAQRIGISGFCAYHYWFDGRIALDKLLELLKEASIELGYSYLLCWANESWTKRWVGRSDETIISQTYTMDETLVRKHVDYLSNHFSAPSYYRIEDRPVFFIYNPTSVGFMEILPMYRKVFASEGINPFLVSVETEFLTSPKLAHAFDMTIRFEPRAHFSHCRQRAGRQVYSAVKITAKAFPWLTNFLTTRFIDRHKLYSYSNYSDYLTHSLANLKGRIKSGERTTTSLIFHWDNTPRYLGLASKFNGVTEELAYKNIRKVIDWVRDQDIPFFVINAWNEWAEGATLEQRELQDFDSSDVVSRALETNRSKFPSGQKL